MAQFDVNSTSVENIISSIKAGDIAIPEIQRPFVWDATKVRDLMDSLYKGFPVGYIIVWKNPDIRLKDGKISYGKKILIDGQQRITAIQAAIVGQEVVDASYKKKRITIAFNPIEETFEVCNPAIRKKYLQKNGVNNRKDYNQIANYVYTQSEINIKIKDTAPRDYMSNMKSQISGAGSYYGNINNAEDLDANLSENCIPKDIVEMDVSNYNEFLSERRIMMAQYIKEYYQSLK